MFEKKIIKQFNVGGMKCVHCAKNVKKALEKLQQDSQEIATKLYQNVNPNGNSQGDAGAQGADGDNVHVNPDDVKVD